MGNGYLEQARRQYKDALTVFSRGDHPQQWYITSLLLLQVLAAIRYAQAVDEADLLQAVSIADELLDAPQAAPAEGITVAAVALRANALTEMAVRNPDWYEPACEAQRAAAAAGRPEWPLVVADASLALGSLLITYGGDETEATAALEEALTVYRPGQQPTGWAKAHFFMHHLLAARAESCADLLAACQHLEDVAIAKPPAVDAGFYALICQQLAVRLTDSRCPEDPERLGRAMQWSEECLRYWPEEDLSHRMEHCHRLGRGYFRRYEERYDLADLERAVTLLDQATTLARQVGAPAGQAIEYWHDAAVARMQIKTDERQNRELAIGHLTTALEAYGSELTPQERARVSQTLGTAYVGRITGDPADNQERAIGHLDAALAAHSREALPDQWASAAHDLSGAYWRRIAGDHGENLEKAIFLAEAAAKIRTREKDPRLWARTMHSLGNLYNQRPLGDREANLERSIRFSRAALEVETKDAMPDVWAGAMRNLGNAYHGRIAGDRRQNLETAVGYFRGALSVTSRQLSLRAYAETLLGLGNALGSLGELAQDSQQQTEAVAVYEQAASAFAELGSPDQRAAVRFNQAMLLSRIHPDSPGPALAALRECLPAWDAQHNPLRAPGVYQVLAFLSDRAGATAEAYDWICKALEAGEVLYAGASREDSKTWLVADNANGYLFAVDLALRSGAGARAALLLAERGRARMLREAVVPQQPGWNIPAALLAQEADVIRRRRQAWATIATTDQVTGTPEGAFVEAEAATGELAALWEQMRGHPGGDDYVATRKGAMGWEQLRGWMQRQPTGFALLEYVVIPDSTVPGRVVAFVVRQDQPEPVAVDIPIDIRALAHCVQAFYSEMDGSRAGQVRRETWDRVALPLMTMVKPHLAGIRLLCIIPHLMLHHFPLHALGDSGATLLDEMAIYYSPSATVAIRLAQGVHAGEVTGGARAVVAGDSLGDLPHARVEAEHVGRLLGVQPLIGTKATLSAVLAQLPGVRLAHFACHGYLRIDDPAGSAVLLADGALAASKLKDIGLDCDLLVLSGCDTGFQPLERTLEVGGLPSALIAAGARRAVGCLWPVNDQATERLFTVFYQELTGGSMDVAADEVTRSVAGCLRAAALALRQVRPERYFWAPFIVVGTW